MVYHGSLIHKPGKIPFRWPFRGWRYLATASGVIFLFWKTSLSETRRAGHAFSQWPWLRNRLRTEVPTICKAYFSGLCKGIYPQNMALYGKIPPINRILEISHWFSRQTNCGVRWGSSNLWNSTIPTYPNYPVVRSGWSGWGIHIHHIPYEIRSYLEFANHLIASD